MSTISITYIEQNEEQVKKTFDTLMVWYSMDPVQVLAALNQNPIAVTNQDIWTTDIKGKVQVYKDWVVDESILIGDIRRYEEVLYVCIQAHTTQADWTPPLVPALFNVAFYEEGEFPDWVQPAGAQDAYALGDKVTHTELHWESTVADNVWEPGVYGWTQI